MTNREIREIKRPDAERFWSKVDKSGDCWLWTAARWSTGYGGMKISGSRYLAHRIAYAIANGSTPGGMSVLHECDTPLCVRPDHLSIGTQAKNMADAVSRNRFRRSKDKPLGWRKLNPELVAEIRALGAARTGYDGISKKYGISRGMVGHIVRRKAWAWV